MPAYCTLHAAYACCRPTGRDMLVIGQCQHVLRLPAVPGSEIVSLGCYCCLLDRAKLRLYIVTDYTMEKTLRCRSILL